MIKPGRFYLPIYSMNYFYFIGHSSEEVRKYIKKKLNADVEIGGERGKCFFFENDEVAVCMIYVKSKKDIVALGHECIHAANFTLLNVGVKVSPSNDEAQTYLFDAIFEEGLKSK